MELEILPPTSDFVFKMLFGDSRNTSMLKDFLQSFLELPDEEYELTFLNTHVKPEFEGDKLGILDVKVSTASGKVIDIEIQVNPVLNIGKRLSFYKSKLIVEQIAEGDSYSVIQQVICICITDYELFPRIKEHWNRFGFYNPENGLYFKEIPEEIHTIELVKVPAQSDGSTGWEWLQFLRSREKEEFEMAAVKNPEIRKAVDTLYQLSANEMVRAEYEARKKAERDYINGMEGAYQQGEQKGLQKGIQKGLRKGLQKGRREAIENTARNALAQSIPLEVIQKITGLSQEEISKL